MNHKAIHIILTVLLAVIAAIILTLPVTTDFFDLLRY
jgi:hypothetical protein